VFFNYEIKVVVVPHFSELAANKVQALVSGNPLFTAYLPDLHTLRKVLSRQYIYNVSLCPWSPVPSVDREHHRHQLLP
jgi:hypothetical protein